MHRYALGVDIGGTKVSVTLGNSRGKILAKKLLPTLTGKNARQGIHDLAAALKELKLHEGKGKKIQGIDPEVLDILVKYDWPGNIRELKNIIERMVVLAHEDRLHADNVPEDLRSGNIHRLVSAGTQAPASTNLDQLEKELIQRVLGEVKGNKSLAAKKLGISRRTLYRKLEEYTLDSSGK